MIQKTILLGDLATARSGRWNTHLSLGVVAFTEANYQFLVRELTVMRIREYFTCLNALRVDRFELPNVWALNFVLYDFFFRSIPSIMDRAQVDASWHGSR